MPVPAAHEVGDSAALLGRGAILRISAALALAALAIIGLGRCTNVDLVLADLAFDRNAAVFPWRDAWLTATFSHGILKGFLTGCGLFAIGVAARDVLRPSHGAAHSLRLRIVALSAMLAPLVTSTLKASSDAHCPWDLQRYGGTQPYVRLFDALPYDAVAGHCLPGGHASTALWLISLGVFWLPKAPRQALAVAAAAGSFGMAVGWMQQLRGAHFLTHTLWSMWVAALVVLLAVVALQQAGAMPRHLRLLSAARAAQRSM